MFYGLGGREVPLELKGKFYHTIIRLAVLYRTECSVVKSQQEDKFNATKMRMLC